MPACAWPCVCARLLAPGDSDRPPPPPLRSSWLFAYDTWCHAVLIAPLPGLSSRFGYRSRVASSAAEYTTAKSVSYSDRFARFTSALPPQATAATSAPKMIRCDQLMGV